MADAIFHWNIFLCNRKCLHMELTGIRHTQLSALTWKCRIMVQTRPSVSFGFPSTISSDRMLTRRIWKRHSEYIMWFRGISYGWWHLRQMQSFTWFYVCSLVEVFMVPFMLYGSLLKNNCSLYFDGHINANREITKNMHKTKWRIVDFCVLSDYFSTWHQRKLNIHCWLWNLWKHHFFAQFPKYYAIPH